MKHMWEFFEQLDEMVYVTDIETHELVYMNRHLRKALGYRSHEEYVGRKCHQVLQGLETPCVFCTDDQLREGEFVSWTHKNPVLNKRFLVKDTLTCIDKKRYRIEIAIDADSEKVCQTPYYYARSETILNECLHHAFSTASAEESLENMLLYLGKTFSSDRAYIFEIYNTGVAANTYEWCAEGVTPQKELLQEIPPSAIDWWLTMFTKNEVMVIPNLEDIREKYPESYAILKPQDIRSLAAGPIKEKGRVIGFLGLDNPNVQMMALIQPLLKVIGYFVTALLRRRDLHARLHELSYHDQLTGAYNRHALAEYYEVLDMDSVGVIYCDITGLKWVNDNLGHEAGDQMICTCYETLREAVDSDKIYRSGGDEFVALCPNCTEEAFQDTIWRLRQKRRESEYHMAVGYAWSDKQPLVLEDLIVQADKLMYQDKRRYYEENDHLERRRNLAAQEDGGQVREPTTFQRFLQSAYCDVESLFQSSSQDNDSSYFYLGDMQKDLFYISDNMRDDFGFRSNLVPHLLQKWARRISTPEFQDLFWQDISGMLREKRTFHDLRYRVRDVQGNNQWIRCYGILKWNEDRTKPLFFSGRVTHQDKNFVVDPISNFPREQAFFRQLNELKKNGERTIVIGFGLNGVAEVNSTKGRAYGDRLLKKLADALMEALSWKMFFYRTDGMRCLAIVNPLCQKESNESLVEQIREIAKTCYESMGISLQNVCSFGVMEYPCGDFSPEDLLDTMISLIRLARQETKLRYVDYSDQNIQRMKRMSNVVLALGQDVAHNMENFRIVVQPVVSAGDGHVCGGEVLLRWSFEGRDVSPAAFIPVLEKEGLIQQVGRWVFEQAVCTCVRLHAYDPTFYLTFNVSFHQLNDTQLVGFMEQMLEKYHLEGSSLVAELTENSLDEEPEKLMEFVDACQRLGIYTALDDFGSGYSSLRMLLQYPSSIIKLDRSLVQEIMESNEKMDFIRSIVFACHQFGKTVCVEGVEDAEQNEIIIATGCDMIQGYYYHRPMELSDLYRLISQSSSEAEKEGV